MKKNELPYFDILLEEFQKQNTQITAMFGEHVHWGYWTAPEEDDHSTQSFSYATKNMVKTMCDLADIDNQQSILDVGCGLGGTISYLNHHFLDSKIFGLNIDDRQLNHARRKLNHLNNNVIHLINADACQMPFKNCLFDRILAIECIFHFHSRQTFLMTAKNLLKENGSIVISDFIIKPVLKPGNIFFRYIKGKNSNPFGYMKFMTLPQYHQLAQELGLKLEINNINQNTLPTYPHLKKIAPALGFGKIKTLQVNLSIDWLHYLAKIGLSTYQVLKSTKTE